MRTKHVTMTVAVGLVAILLASPTAAGADATEAAQIKGWAQLAPPVSPPAGVGEMAYDSTHDHTVLVTAPLVDPVVQTWVWDGTTWSQLNPDVSPPWRGSAVLVYDRIRDETLLFGGIGRQGFIDDTWILAGGQWTERHPAYTPPVGHSGAAAFDPNLGKIVLFGGEADSGSTSRGMWSWDGVNWAPIVPETVPKSRAEAGLAYDAARDGLVLYGGFNGGPSYVDALDDTWFWDGEDWTELDPIRVPKRRSNLAMATFGRHVVLFGGVDVWRHAEVGSYGDTWVLRKKSWRKVRSDPRPVDRSNGVAAWDQSRQELVMFGGNGEAGALDDTWVLTRS